MSDVLALAAEHRAVLAGRITDYGSHATGCPADCPYRTGASLALAACANCDRTMRSDYGPLCEACDPHDGRDGSIEAEDDDEDRIAAEDAAREEMHELVEWQRSLKGW